MLVIGFFIFAHASYASDDCATLLNWFREGKLKARIEKIKTALLGDIDWSKLDSRSPQAVALAEFTLTRDLVDVLFETASSDPKLMKEVAVSVGKDGTGLRKTLNEASRLRTDVADRWLHQADPKYRAALDGALHTLVESRKKKAVPVLPETDLSNIEVDDIVVVTHQQPGLQQATAEFLAKNKLLKKAPRVALVSPDYRVVTEDFLNQLSTARYSSDGRAPKLPASRRVHLMGGNLEECFSKTIDDMIAQYIFKNEERSGDLQFFFYRDLIYSGPKTLREILKEKSKFTDLSDLIEAELLMPDSLDALGLVPYTPPLKEKGKKSGLDFFYIHKTSGKIIHFHIL